MGNCLILPISPSLSSSPSSSRSDSMCSISSCESCEAMGSGGGGGCLSFTDSDALRRILPFPTLSDLGAHYQLEHELGRGQHGVIRLCRCRTSHTLFACKSISKRRVKHVHDILREVRIMQRLSLPSAAHPIDVVRLHQVIEDSSYVHLIMELCRGGELFDSIVKRKRCTEPQAASIIKSLMQSIQACHQMGVMHRDLKPENILLVDDSDSSPIKLADFGLAVEFSPGEKFSGMVGSTYYIAPEVLQGKYSEEIDVWSAGVVLYMMLSGVPPFWGETDNDIFEAIREGNLEFTWDLWNSISFSAKDLIRGMLCADVKARLTPAQVLEHPWIRHHTKEPKQASQQQHCKEIMSSDSAPVSNAHALGAKNLLAVHRPSSTSLTASSVSPDVVSNERKAALRTLTFSNTKSETLQLSHLDNGVKTDRDALAVALVAKFDVNCLPMPESLAELSLQGGWSCALLSFSPTEQIFAVEVAKRSYLISHNSTRKTGWKILGRHHHKGFSPSLHVNTQPQPIV